jgi:alkylation response protein AidB-like acyl-CoA dehydrogenase
VERFYRDAKVMEIIEGSTQIQQMTIADYAYQQYLSA